MTHFTQTKKTLSKETRQKKERMLERREKRAKEERLRLDHNIMEQSINPHAYCRLRFDEAAEEAIENLANVLQWHRNSPFEGLFVAQKDARAGKHETSSFFNI